jgi:hypothetical protein
MATKQQKQQRTKTKQQSKACKCANVRCQATGHRPPIQYSVRNRWFAMYNEQCAMCMFIHLYFSQLSVFKRPPHPDSASHWRQVHGAVAERHRVFTRHAAAPEGMHWEWRDLHVRRTQGMGVMCESSVQETSTRMAAPEDLYVCRVFRGLQGPIDTREPP